VLHGSPLHAAEERAERLARPPANLASVTWAVLGQFLSGPYSPTYNAVFANDLPPDIAAIRAPTLLLSDRHDLLHPNDLKVAAMRPDFTYQEFSS
jgi:pimeloyl-ACP methyl ester carboxylesterase